MGYFDKVKQESRPPLEVVSSNVTPLRRSSGGDLHPYARHVVDAELARLDQCRSAPLGYPPHWDDTTYEVACNLIEIANSPWSGYTLAQARRDLDDRAPRDAGFDQHRIDQKWDSASAKIGASGRPQPAPEAAIPTPTILTVPDLTDDEADAFWDARDILSHLHDFARARRVSPWAVLGVALARVITATPPQVCLPPIIGGRASLNLFVGLVGPSGSGKGAAEAVAADALQVGYIVSHNVGSGEGIAHGYMHHKKGELVWNDDDHAVLFSVPEIDSLAAQGDRKGATLMPQLRSGWTGEQLGFGYADPTKRIIVPAHEYRLCLVAGIQPGRAACLLDDADGGTPQRFLWLPATDPDAPDHVPAEPTPRVWSRPPLGSLTSVGGVKLGVCDTARDTIVTNRVARLRGEGDALDGHALLAQLKAAAALALAERRLEVTDEDWRLADLIMRKSAATRAGVVDTLRAKATESNHARAQAEASRAVLVEETVLDAAVKRVCKTVVRRLAKEGDWTPSADLRRAVASQHRRYFEDAMTRLVDAGQVEHQESDRGLKYRLSKEGA